MRLLVRAHKVLIGAAIVLALFLCPWGIREWRRTGDRTSLILAGASLAVAVGLLVYLRKVVKRYARLEE